MNILVTDPYNAPLTTALMAAVDAASLAVETVSLADNPNVIERYRLSQVPCVARIHGGVAVYLTNDPNLMPVFDANADAVVAALTPPVP